MTDYRTVGVRLKADVGGYKTSMGQAAKATTEVDKAAQKAQARSEKWRAVGMASKVAGAAIAAGLLYAAKAASNQEQALGSLTAVFKTNSAAMLDNAEKASKIGLSMTDYANSAAKLGAQLGNLGVSQTELAGTTQGMIEDAADLAAMFGGTTSQAVDALGAAFRGEADPAERYGLSLGGLSVKAEMAATGADKATAMLALLNKQMETSGAAGAAAREYDSVAAATQRAQAEFDNATASLGKALLPALSKAAETVAQLIGAFNSMPEGVKTAVTIVAAFGAAALLAGPKIVSMAAATMELKAAMLANGIAVSGAAGKMKGFAATAGKVGMVGTAVAAGLPLIGDLVTSIGDSMYNATSRADQLTPTLANLVDGQSVGAIGQFGEGLEGLNEELTGLMDPAVSTRVADFFGTLAMNGGDERRQRVLAEITAIDESLVKMAQEQGLPAAQDAFDKLAESQNLSAEQTAELKRLMTGLSDEEAKVAGATNGATEAIAAQSAIVAEATASYEKYIADVRQALGLMSAKDALIGQEGRLGEAVKKNGDALRGQTAKAAANRAAIGAEVTSISDLVEQTYESVKAKKGEAEAARAANRVRRQQIASLMESAEAAGYDADETKRLLKRLDLLKPIKTTVKVDGIEYANKQAAKLAGSLGQILRNSGLKPGGGIDWTFGGHAAGGLISGPGSGTSDSIPARLSNGEYVMTARAVDRIGVAALDAMNYAGYAGGGHVTGGGGGTGGGRGAGSVNLAVGAGRALRQVQVWRDAVKQARANVKDLRQQAKEYADTVANNVLSAGGADLFESFSRSGIISSWKDLAAAQDTATAASRRVYEAQVAVSTSSPENRAQALEELADAQRDQAAASTEQAKAEAAAKAATPTPEAILGRMRDRARLVGEYATKVKSLTSKGLSMALIKDLAGADPIEAGPVLDALLKMSGKQLRELGSLDAQTRAAAASAGSAVAKKVFKKDKKTAKIELTASTKGLDKAIKAADRTIDKDWRKKLAKAGLGAEERVQLLQAVRDNDGKLTTHWRNILAKAGLSAEERGDLVDVINGADTTLTDYWRVKLAKAGLSAEDRGDLQASLIANDGKLTREWRDKLAAAGLSASERNNLITNGIRDADTKARVDWANNDYAADLDARKEQVETKLGNVRGDAKVWNDATYSSKLDAMKEHFETKLANVRTNARDWNAATYSSKLDALKEDFETKLGKVREKAREWGRERYNATLGIKVAADAMDAANEAAAWAKAFERWQAAARKNARKAGPAPTPGNLGRWGKKDGGMIRGAGTGTSDSILAALSNGEFVVRASSVEKYGMDLLNAINTGRFASGGPVGYRNVSAPPAGGAFGLTLTSSSVPVVVQLDSRTLAAGQLKLRRQSGGTVTLGG